MEKYYVAFDMSPKHKQQHDYLQVIIAEKNEDWTPNDYVPPVIDDDDDDTPADPTDETDKEEDDVDPTPGIDTSDMGEGEHDIPKPRDGASGYDNMQQNMYIIIIGCSLTVFVLITILTCCCCKKRAYRYKSLNLGADDRTFTQTSDDVQQLDQSFGDK